MDDAKELLKKYWPYIVGGIVGLYILLRYNGGGSASSGSSDYAALLAAQSQAASQNAAIGAQAAQAAGTLQLNRDALNAQIAKDNATLELQKKAVQAEAFNNFQSSQAAMAKSIGESTAGLITALNAPSITAMAAGAQENAAALLAAGNVAASAFTTQGNIVNAGASTVAAVGNAVGNMQPISITPKPSMLETVLGAANQGFATYMNGGFGGYGVNYGGRRFSGNNPLSDWGF